MMSHHILIVEDDMALRTGLVDTFAQEGYGVTEAPDGEAAVGLLTNRSWDLVVLDLMLPGRSGLEILKELRTGNTEVPVLILTAKSDETDKVLGLELGADDYLTKPFGLRELVARVRALLRRGERSRLRPEPAQFQLGEATVNLAAFEVERGDTTHVLSQKEAAMLALLHTELGRVVSRRRFLAEVWGNAFVGNRTVDTHVLNLRKKIETDPKEPRHLLTVHGAGYKLVL